MKGTMQLTTIPIVLTAVFLAGYAPAPEKLTLSKFNDLRGNNEATGTFVIEGTVHSYGVDLAGSTLKNIKTKDGRKFHYLRLKGKDGTRTIVWLDSKRVSLPSGGDLVRVKGHFENIGVLAAPGPIVDRTIGRVDKIRVMSR